MKKSEALRVLGLGEGAIDEEIKKAHRRLVIANHPDKFALNSLERVKAEERTKLINEARDVLLQKSWTPEFDPRRDARPYANNPYAHPGNKTGYGSQSAQNPYEGWPFQQGGTTYVWTSWDGVHASGRSDRSDSNGFDPFAPFRTKSDSMSPRQVLEEAKRRFSVDAILVVIKVMAVVVSALLGSAPTGLFLYVMTSIIIGSWRKIRSCLVSFFIPFALVMAALVFFIAPRQGSVTLALGIAFVVSVLFDVGNIRKRWRLYRSAKQALG